MRSLEHQKAVLGLLSLSSAAYIDVCELIQPFMFDEGPLRKTAEFIWLRHSEGMPFDVPLLKGYLKQEASLVNELIQSACSRQVLCEHASNIRDEWMLQQLQLLLFKSQEDLSEQGAFYSIVSHFNKEVELLQSQVESKDRKLEHLNTLMKDIFEANPGGLSGIETGFNELDRFTSGWQKGDLIIIAGRPHMGKTTVMCEYTLGASEAGKTVAYFTMGDLTAKQLYKKLAGMIAQVGAEKLRSGQLTGDDGEKVFRALELLSVKDIYAYDIKDLAGQKKTVRAIQDKARALSLKLANEDKQLDLVIVDYIQQLKSEDARLLGAQKLDDITKDLKAMAVILDVPVLAGSQIGRGVEHRGGSKRPQMSDLKGSGSIEEDADSIQLLYRPEYYRILEDEEGQSLKGVLEVIYVKDRVAGDQCPYTFKAHYQDCRLYGKDELEAIEQAKQNILIAPVRIEEDEELPF